MKTETKTRRRRWKGQHIAGGCRGDMQQGPEHNQLADNDPWRVLAHMQKGMCHCKMSPMRFLVCEHVMACPCYMSLHQPKPEALPGQQISCCMLSTLSLVYSSSLTVKTRAENLHVHVKTKNIMQIANTFPIWKPSPYLTISPFINNFQCPGSLFHLKQTCCHPDSPKKFV